MTIVNQTYALLPEDLRILLYKKYTLPYSSHMKQQIDNNFEGIDTFIMIDKEKIIGWGMVVGWIELYNLLMIYVPLEFRHKGIATKIVKEVKLKYKNIGMLAYDEESYNIINKISKNIDIYIEVL